MATKKTLLEAIKSKMIEDPRREYIVTTYSKDWNAPNPEKYKSKKEFVSAKNPDELSHEMAFRIGNRKYPEQKPHEFFDKDYPFAFKATEFQGPGKPIPEGTNTSPRKYYRDESIGAEYNMNYVDEKGKKWWEENYPDAVKFVPNESSEAKRLTDSQAMKYENPRVYEAMMKLQKHRQK